MGDTKLELSSARGDLSTSEAIKSQLESEIHDLSIRCKDYKKKIMVARENAELVARRHVNKYLRLDVFKAKVFEQSTHFCATSFNDGFWVAWVSPAAPLSTLHAVEYETDGEEVQYGLDDCAPQKALVHLEVEFDQGTNQVGDDPPNL